MESKGRYPLSVPFDAVLGASVQAATRVSAPGEAGQEYVLKVDCDEGVAITSSLIRAQASVRTSAGACLGEPLSRETIISPSADLVYSTEGKIGRRYIASAHELGAV